MKAGFHKFPLSLKILTCQQKTILLFFTVRTVQPAAFSSSKIRYLHTVIFVLEKKMSSPLLKVAQAALTGKNGKAKKHGRRIYFHRANRLLEK